MEIARGTDLPDLLASLGYTVTRIGRYYSTKEMDSLRIKNRRTWYRYSERVGGDAITFLQHFCGRSFPEAVEDLLAFHGRARDAPAERSRQTEQAPEPPKPFALPPRHTDARRVYAYLKKRGVSPQIIRSFISAGLLYEDSEHHNCVFVGYDRDGKAAFASLRGTYDRDGSGFKGDAAGSDKSIGFRLPYAPDSRTVYVFEAPIDLMSYQSSRDWKYRTVAVSDSPENVPQGFPAERAEQHGMLYVFPSKAPALDRADYVVRRAQRRKEQTR